MTKQEVADWLTTIKPTAVGFQGRTAKIDHSCVQESAHDDTIIIDKYYTFMTVDYLELEAKSIVNGRRRTTTPIFDSPIGPDDWHGFEQVRFIDFTIESFVNLPNVPVIQFQSGLIKSMSGAKNLTKVESIHFGHMLESDSNSPLNILQLFKMPALHSITVHAEMKDRKLLDAINMAICIKKIKGDLMECQNMLIDAGLEQYAHV